MPVRTVTFDFWMTLYRDSATALRIRTRARRKLFGEFLRRHRREGSEAEIAEAWQGADKVFHGHWQEQQRAFPMEERIAVVLERLGVRSSRAEQAALAGAYEDCSLVAPPRLIAGVRTTIPRLAGKYALGIICDTGITPGRLLRRFLERDGLMRHFRHCVFSDETGRTKPHVGNFQKALTELGAEAGEAVHVGDLIRTDVRGAQGAGMKAVLFTGITKYTPEQLAAEADGVPVVESFHKIPAALRAMEP